MLVFTRRRTTPSMPATHADLELDHQQRRRVRGRAQLLDGTPVVLDLPRGTLLSPGEQLETETGARTTVRAASERVCVAAAANPRQLARLAYHLGNRHVAVQLDESTICFLQDPLLARMCAALGATVDYRSQAFEPESLGTGTAAHAHPSIHEPV